MTMTAEQHKIKQQADDLYERYAKPLEAEHTGKFVAVSPEGQTIVGETMGEVARQATAAFGRGIFLFKVGQRAVGRWR